LGDGPPFIECRIVILRPDAGWHERKPFAVRADISGHVPFENAYLHREVAVADGRGAVLTDYERRWDNPTMIVTLDAKRRLTVPASLAPTSPGDYFDARFDAEEDALVFRRLPGRESWLSVLKACPVSPDDVPRRRRAAARRRKL
jgi:hypothetical protein